KVLRLFISVTRPRHKHPFEGRPLRSAIRFVNPRRWLHLLPWPRLLTRAIYALSRREPAGRTRQLLLQPTNHRDTSCEGMASPGSVGWTSAAPRSPSGRSSRSQSYSKEFALSA